MVLKFDELKTILFYSYSYTVDRECFCFFVFFYMGNRVLPQCS